MLDLNKNELEALRILWERGASKPAEVQALFSWPIENGTLRATLVNLVEKGHATRAQNGKAFYYASSIPKARLLQTMTRTLARVFAGGSHTELVAQLVKTGDLKPSDLEHLLQAAAGRRANPKRRQNELADLLQGFNGPHLPPEMERVARAGMDGAWVLAQSSLPLARHPLARNSLFRPGTSSCAFVFVAEILPGNSKC